jgi:hypothetical protein
MRLSQYFPVLITVRHPVNVLLENAVAHLAGSVQIARVKFALTTASLNWVMENVI